MPSGKAIPQGVTVPSGPVPQLLPGDWGITFMPIREVSTTGSKPFDWSKEDWKRLFKGAMLAAVGAGGAAIIEYASGYNFGQYDLLAGALCSVAANALRMYLMNTQQDVAKTSG